MPIMRHRWSRQRESTASNHRMKQPQRCKYKPANKQNKAIKTLTLDITKTHKDQNFISSTQTTLSQNSITIRIIKTHQIDSENYPNFGKYQKRSQRRKKLTTMNERRHDQAWEREEAWRRRASHEQEQLETTSKLFSSSLLFSAPTFF